MTIFGLSRTRAVTYAAVWLATAWITYLFVTELGHEGIQYICLRLVVLAVLAPVSIACLRGTHKAREHYSAYGETPTQTSAKKGQR